MEHRAEKNHRGSIGTGGSHEHETRSRAPCPSRKKTVAGSTVETTAGSFTATRVRHGNLLSSPGCCRLRLPGASYHRFHLTSVHSRAIMVTVYSVARSRHSATTNPRHSHPGYPLQPPSRRPAADSLAAGPITPRAHDGSRGAVRPSPHGGGRGERSRYHTLPPL